MVILMGKLSSLTYLVILFILESLAICYGNECLLPKRELKEGELPHGYVHCPIPQQMTYYRQKVYDEALVTYQGNVDDLKTKPIKGLSPLLENAFALVNDYISKDTTRSDKEKKIYIDALLELWEKAKGVENQLTSSLFQGFNKNIAYIADCYKNKAPIDRNKLIGYISPLYPNWDKIIEEGVATMREHLKEDDDKSKKVKKACSDALDDLVTFIEKGKTDSHFHLYGFSDVMDILKTIQDNYTDDINDEPYMPEKVNNPNEENIIFIIYGNPNREVKARNISPFHFVDQYCNPTYSSYILFFDMLSAPLKPTKKDPHWSMENGTYQMLKHDVGHVRAQISGLKDKKKFLMQACSLIEEYKESSNYNAATVLTNGLFIIIHERPEVTQYDLSMKPVHSFKQITQNLQNIMSFNTRQGGSLGTYGSKTYKQENRDWEYILKNTYIDPKDKTRKVVHDQDGKPFLPIMVDPDLQKATRPFKDSSNRSNEMTMALSKGYHRYWNYFLSLIENPGE